MELIIFCTESILISFFLFFLIFWNHYSINTSIDDNNIVTYNLVLTRQLDFDLFSEMSLPESDIIIAADVLYNPELATQVGRRIYEAISQNDKIPKLIVTDSQKFHGTDFLVEVTELKELSSLLKERGLEQLQWEMRQLKQVCASGVLVDEDQTYDVDVRMICWGWESQ